MKNWIYAGICISQDTAASTMIDRLLFGVDHSLPGLRPRHQRKTHIVNPERNSPSPPSTKLHLFVRSAFMERYHSALSHCRFSLVFGMPRSHSRPDLIRSAAAGSV